MQTETQRELNRDFTRWIALIDLAGHAENEVERERPALCAAELSRKWRTAAPVEWDAMRAQYAPWTGDRAADSRRLVPGSGSCGVAPRSTGPGRGG